MNIVPLYTDLRWATSIDITGHMYDVHDLYRLDTQKHVQFYSEHQQATPLLNSDYFPSIPPKME